MLETRKVYSFMRPFPHSRYLRHRKPHRTHIGEKPATKKKKRKKKEHCIPFHWCKQGSLFHRRKAGEKVVLPRDVTDKNRVEPRVHAREAKEQEDTVEKKDQEHFHRPARKRERVVKKGSKKRANLAMQLAVCMTRIDILASLV